MRTVIVVPWVTLALLVTSIYGASLYRSLSENDVDFRLTSIDRGLNLESWAGLYPLKKMVATLKTLEVGGSSFHFSCYACKLSAKAIQYLVHAGTSEDRLASLASTLCRSFRVSTDRVCNGLSNAYKDEVLFVFSKVSLNPVDICSSILDEDCGSGVYPSDNWTVALPHVPKPPVTPVAPPEPGSPVLRVLQLSDVHLDPAYQEGASAICGEPLCCRSTDPPATSPDQRAGPWGDYRKCDTPLRTLESLLQHVAETQQVDYVLWTGDDPPHNVWNQTKEGQMAVMRKVATLIRSYFPGVPVFPALGNHEGIPVNSFPPSSYSSSMDWLYEMLSETWTQWLPSETRATILKGGFYSVPVFPGFRIISLNMNYCNDLNWWLLLNTTDPLGELQWLINQLENAEVTGEKVHIIGHIPPGTFDCMKMWSANYYRIVNRYESTIRGQFFGHTHFDEFEMFYDDAERRPASVAYVGPSVTPYASLNPAYRIYVVDGNRTDASWAVLDHETYFLNLTEANLSGRDDWNFLYAAKSAYNMTSMQPDEWQHVWSRLATNDTFFQRFYRHSHRGSAAAAPCNDALCRRNWLCRLRSGRSGDAPSCNQSGSVIVLKGTLDPISGGDVVVRP